MKVAILETGRPPAALAATFGDYPSMIEAMLGEGFEIESFDVQAGDLPSDPTGHEAYVITGSPAGVYEPLPWIDQLSNFIRAASGTKMVGICFGHQIMAQALGGHVEKSSKGWGIGLQRYAIVEAQSWMDSASHISVPVSHQDQIVVQPPDTFVVAASPFTPYAALAWSARPAISVQFHPEFETDFAKALIGARRDRLPDPDGAIASLDAPNDSRRVADWIRRFLKS